MCGRPGEAAGTARAGRWAVALATLAGVAGAAPAPARADTAAGGSNVAFYVSDQFKAVARKAFRQYAAEEIAKACPADRPICATVVRRLADAFDAAMTGDDPGLQQALKGFLRDAAMNAILEIGVGDLFSGGLRPDAQAASLPLIRCASAAFADGMLPAQCLLAAPEADKLAALVPQFIGTDKERADDLIRELRAGRRPDVAQVLDVLAAVASLEGIDRHDLRVYLVRLASLWRKGLKDSAFDAFYGFLKDEGDGSGDLSEGPAAIERLLASTEKEPSHRLLDVRTFSPWRDALVACGQNPRALDEWQRAVQTGAVQRIQGALLTGQPMDLAPLRALRAYNRCADPKASEQIAQLKRQTLYFLAPLELHQGLSQFAVPGLAAAAMIDFVRNGDEAALRRDVLRMVLFGGAQAASNRMMLAKPAPKSPVWPRDVLASCQGRRLHALFGLAPPPAANAGKCRDLMHGKDETKEGDLPDPPPGGVVTSEWLLAQAAELRPLLDWLLQPAAPASAGVLSILRRASESLQAGQLQAAGAVMIRTGVELIVTELETFAEHVVGKTKDVCIVDTRARWIWSKGEGQCAAYLLITSAVRPVADYYWQNSLSPDDAPALSKSVYRRLLASPALDYSPLILNVGLGATFVGGSGWGSNGYTALTVLDKYGIAIYRQTEQKWRFEMGVFVGGFLDALVRTVAEEGEAQRYWLAGLTFGWPRMFGRDLGVEFHGGAALPFSFGSGSRYGIAAGGAIVIPFDTVFDDDEEK